jgi:ABC-2 type transport system ATP-binding protein
VIHCRDLTKEFESNLAVDRLTLDINAGEVLGLLGPNGAGKTTTARMLACLIRPSSVLPLSTVGTTDVNT